MKEGTEMKKMKKMMALVIAVVMMMAMTMTTMAEDTYSITIKNPVVGQTYSAYKLFDVTYSGNNYSYTVTNNTSNEVTDWYDVLKDSKYFSFTEIGDTEVYNVEKTSQFNAVNFAADLNELLQDTKNTEPDYDAQSVKVTSTDASVTISLTSAGYYFVDSTLGSLCSLGTADNTVEISEKNAFPIIDKTVYEDSTGTYGASATVDIFEDISFKLTVNTGVGYKENDITFGTGNDADFVITDVFTNGTVDWDSVVITDEGGTITNSKKEAVWTKNQDYEIDSTNNKITLKTSALSQLAADKDIYIVYTAKLTNATVDTNYANTATLNYKGYTMSDSASVITYDIDILKYTGENTPLAGATFRLYKMEGSTPKYALITDGKLTGWDNVGTALTSPSDGKLSVDGLDADTYFLEETAAPSGYNKLTSPIQVVITEDGIITYGDSITYDKDNSATYTTITNEKPNIEIENKTGSLLPETGGIGTTVFYAAGALLVIAGVVVLVTRKRMENQ